MKNHWCESGFEIKTWTLNRILIIALICTEIVIKKVFFKYNKTSLSELFFWIPISSIVSISAGFSFSKCPTFWLDGDDRWKKCEKIPYDCPFKKDNEQEVRGLFSACQQRYVPGVDDECPGLEVADVHRPHDEVGGVAGRIVHLPLLLLLLPALSAPQNSWKTNKMISSIEEG